MLPLAANADADDPLALGGQSSAGRWLLSASMIYSNSENSTVKSGDYTVVQTGPGQYVQVPTLSPQSSNSDTLILFSGVNYSVTDDTGISLHVSGRSSWVRTETADGAHSNNTSRFSNVSLGMSHAFTNARKAMPTLLGFLNLTLADNVASSGTELVYGKSLGAGVAAYKYTDPVILSATAIYQMNLERSVNGAKLTPGNLFVFNPTVDFSANTFIGISAGFVWTLQQASAFETKPKGLHHTQTGLNFGLSYDWSEHVMLQASVDTNISGGGGASTGLTMIYSFDNKLQTKSPDK